MSLSAEHVQALVQGAHSKLGSVMHDHLCILRMIGTDAVASLQDTVLVIYSVDYQPHASTSGASATMDGGSIETQWKCLCFNALKPETAQPNNSKGVEDFQSSQCRPANAWGKESWGMRLASVQGTAIRRIASELREQTVATA